MIQIPKIKNIPISDLMVDGLNPNKMTDKQRDALKKNMQRYGFIIPIITNKEHIIADGQHRWEVAKDLGLQEVPVIALDVEEVDRRMLRQILNKLHGEHQLELDAQEFQFLLDNNAAQVFEELSTITAKELNKVISQANPVQTVEDAFNIDSVIEKPKYEIKRGEVWQLDTHRLVCGDCTSAEDVRKLLGNEQVNMLCTDPPYGVDYAGKNEFLNQQDKGNRIQDPYENDTLEDYETWFKQWLIHIPFASYNTFYIWINGRKLRELMNATHSQGMQATTIIIWVKNNHVLARTDYLPKHELCLYGWKGKHKFYGINAKSILEHDKPLSNDIHPTMKPIALFAETIGHGSKEGDIVLDFFGGSGTTLIACEQLKRRCRIMEIMPKYCSAIIQRWEEFTGKKAVRIDGE